ncbi:MAG: NUDIX domain-containing protein [Nanoarchaeota archaeon]
MVKEVLVVKRKTLFKEKAFQGFIEMNDNFLDLIMDNCEYQLRNEDLEINPDFKQIIPYVVIVNPQTKQIFGYKRFKKMAGIHEMRLHDKFSFGVGGHIDREEEVEDVIFDALMRELREEVKMEEYPVPNLIGFVNDDSTEVGEVHLGIIAIAETLGSVGKMEGDEVRDEKFYSIEEIDALLENKEIEADSWTRIAWQAVKEYLTKLG